MQLLETKTSAISSSAEYISFRSSIPQKKIIVDEDSSKIWTLYDAGPRNITCPLICLPPVSGTADVFFHQVMALSAKGYRVISVQYPVYWTMKEWVTGFSKLLDHLNLDKVHLFGASLGGFLAQKFAEATSHTHTVHSIILCNSFTDTSIFNFTDTAVLFWMFPSVVLKRMVMGNFSKGYLEAPIADSIDFMVEKLESLSQPELASRLTLTCMNCYVEPQKLRDIPITIVDVFDDNALSISAREELYKFYPDAKRAHLKKGGNFPYLSYSEEVNLHIQIHLRPFENTKYSACDGPCMSSHSLDIRGHENL
ncbi:Maspardin, partial [Stegodyphus mimosarum]